MFPPAYITTRNGDIARLLHTDCFVLFCFERLRLGKGAPSVDLLPNFPQQLELWARLKPGVWRQDLNPGFLCGWQKLDY